MNRRHIAINRFLNARVYAACQARRYYSRAGCAKRSAILLAGSAARNALIQRVLLNHA
jgi:hypothetical protein